MISFDSLLGGGVAGGFITILGGILYILLNKKVKTPADSAATERAAIVERNEFMGEMRQSMDDLRNELKEAKTKIDQQDSEIDALKQEALERDHYIYRCIHVIQRVGTPEDIPEPNPFQKS
jgi:septal ring factor EnvC (AmiA/AmiB activator)